MGLQLSPNPSPFFQVSKIIWNSVFSGKDINFVGILQIVRHRLGVRRHCKPRHIPRAPSKMFKIVPKNHIPDTEINQILKLKFAHQDKMAALTQFLWEDYLKNSDVGEAAKVEAEKEEQEHVRLLAENDAYNAQVEKKREARVAAEAEETKRRIVAEVQEHEESERQRLRLADDLVLREIEGLKNVITNEESLEKAILEALDNPIDYEFSIDLDGHIYPGRYTKAVTVPDSEKQKITLARREGEIILGIDEKQYRSENWKKRFLFFPRDFNVSYSAVSRKKKYLQLQ